MIIRGSVKSETLEGTIQDDEIIGSRGKDLLSGNSGNDTIQGGGGNDTMDGGKGSDTVDYSDAATGVSVDLYHEKAGFIGKSWAPESITSFEGVIGSYLDDRILGTHGDDWFNGGQGDDYIHGRGGEDWFVFSDGNDEMRGGSGSDTLEISFTQYTRDTASYDIEQIVTFYWIKNQSATVDLKAGTAAATIQSGASELYSIENVVLTDGWNADTVLGSGEDNYIDVGTGADLVRGRGGDDVIIGGSYHDYSIPLYTYNSESLVYRGGSTAGLFGEGSGSQFYGGSGDDQLYGGAEMSGGAGNDRLVMGSSEVDCTMSGGSGADTFVMNTEGYGIAGEIYWSSVYVSDFDPDEGDLIDFYEFGGGEVYVNEFGHADNMASLGNGDIRYSQDEDGTLIEYCGYSYADMTLSVSLDGYTGAVTEALFLFL